MATLGEGDASEIREGRVGETVEVELETATGTGFRWELVPSGEAIVALEESRWCDVDPERPGSPARQQFRFRIVSDGTADLTFCYGRPWESHPTKEYHVRIVAGSSESRESR